MRRESADGARTYSARGYDEPCLDKERTHAPGLLAEAERAIAAMLETFPAAP